MNRLKILKPAAALALAAVIAVSFSGCGDLFGFSKYLFEPEPTRAVTQTEAAVSETTESEQTGWNHGFNSLETEELRTAYRKIEESMNGLYSEEFTLANTTVAMLDEALGAYECDHPESFWLNPLSSYSYVDYGDSLEVELNFAIEGDELSNARETFDSKVSEIVSGAPANVSDYEREKYINDYLVDNCEYSNEGSMCHDAYGALINGLAVCDGYSKAFQVLCGELGIDCVGIQGLCPDFNEENGENSDMGHMWNCVNIGGEWYHFDATWNDGDAHIQRYLFFNLTTEQIEKSHTISAFFGDGISDEDSLHNVFVPECTSTEYNYLKRELVTVYDLDQDDELIAAFLQAVRNGDQYFDFLISEDLDFSECIQEISETYGYQWIEAVNHYNSDGAQISPEGDFYSYETERAVTFELQYVY